MKMKCILTGIILLLSVYGEAAVNIRSIKVEGLKRTKTSVFLKIAGIKEKDSWNRLKKMETFVNLIKAGTFKNIRIKDKAEGEEVDIVIHAEDKQTLIIMPAFNKSKGVTSYGAGFFESNFLGTQKLIGGSFRLKDKKPQVSFTFSDRHFIGNKWKLNVSLNISNEDVAGMDRKATIVRVEPGYKLSKHFTLSPVFGYENIEYDGSTESVYPLKSEHSVIGLKLGYSNIKFSMAGISGMSLSGEFSRVTGKDIKDHFRGIATSAIFIPTFGMQNLSIANQLALTFDGTSRYGYIVSNMKTPGSLPMRGFEENDFMYNNVLSGNVEYKIPLKNFSGFSLSLVTFFDYASMSDKRNRIFKDEFISSAGIACSIYLKNIAMPPLQIYVAHNNDRKKIKVGFLMKMGF